MNIDRKLLLVSSKLGIILGYLLFYSHHLVAQDQSVVLIHTPIPSGYGVAYGGPQNLPDRIVTALHLVAGKNTIKVYWQGKSSNATIEKIYKPSDLALLKLETPLGIKPLTLYSGDPPWETNINFWEFPDHATAAINKTAILEGKSALSKISNQLKMDTVQIDFSKALCFDGGQYYPGMTTEVINFKEPNIRKAHSGSPLTYEDKILGMVDGGTKLVGGKPCVWAIPASDFNKLYLQGTPPPQTLASCDSPTNANKFMYSGIRSDNPLLTAEEIVGAERAAAPISIPAQNGKVLQLHLNYTMSFSEVYETLEEEEKQYLTGLFKPGDSISLDDLLSMTVNFYVEEKTGVSLMIPSECALSNTADVFGTHSVTKSPDGLISLSYYISPNETMQEGMNALNAFKEYINNSGMITSTIEKSTQEVTEHSRYFSDYYEKKSVDTKGNTRAIFYSEFTVNDGDFLGVILHVPDWRPVIKNRQEKLYFYLMEMCTVLSDFTIY